MNKIDSCIMSKNIDTIQSMKPVYSTNEELNCGVIEYNGKTFLVDFNDKDRIINFNKSFVFANDTDSYPSYTYNYKRFNYLDFIFSFSKESVHYVFKNKNKLDLRRCNVEIYHWYHKNIAEKYEVIEYFNGHYLTMGQDANIMKNPIWKVKENDKEYLLMYCEKDTLCKLCVESYKKILDFEIDKNDGKKITWYKHQNGYILCSINLYIHQIITNCYGNGAGTKIVSVDHIDQNPLNNTLENLRIATRKEQEQNSKGIKQGTKRERKTSAKDLPEGITQDMLKKYVVYYQEWLNKEHTREREYFKVEKHPKLDKIWIGKKSNKISIQEKLEQANKIVDDLENDIYPNKDTPTLPKYVSLIVMRDKPHLVFEKKIDGKRLNLKMILPEEYDLDEQLQFLNERIKSKYESETIL
uniref:HNH nuclease domain-containing protein n=1 Tax=viral metagenome TaxID=1070528 RepID=A0A6C0HCI5_9ZZZZ